MSYRGQIVAPTPPQVLWQETGNISANGNSGVIDMTQVSACWFSVFGPNAPTGTSPTLTLTYDQQDAAGNWIGGAIALATVNVTTTYSTFVSFGLGVSPTAPGIGMTLGAVGRISWTVGGSTPVYPGWTLSLIGR